MNIAHEIMYFVFPLLFAGLLHHLVVIRYNLFPFLAKPIDCNRQLRGQPLLGTSKTWRGLLAIPLLSAIGSLIISHIVRVPVTLSPLWVGFLLGAGYAIAELPNSFIKRRLGIRAGEEAPRAFRIFFLIFDQIDSVLGAIFAMVLIYPASFTLCVSILIVGGLLHLVVDFYVRTYGYKKLRNN